jgi:adrenergic receptor alpha-2B
MSQTTIEPIGNTDPALIWSISRIIITAFLSIFILVTILANSFVLYDFISRVKHGGGGVIRLSPSQYFIANLALCDFLVGVFVLPLLASLQVTGKWFLGRRMCTTFVVTHFWLCSASILSTASICFERYIGVSHPLRHARILAPRRIKCILMVVWILAAIPSLLRVFYLHEEMDENCVPQTERLSNALISTVLCFYTPALIMVILYGRIFVIARQHIHSVKEGLKGKNGEKWAVCLGTGETNNYNDQTSSKGRSSTRNGIKNETMNPSSSSQPETCYNKTSSNSTRQKSHSNELIIKLNQNDVNKKFDNDMFPLPKRSKMIPTRLASATDSVSTIPTIQTNKTPKTPEEKQIKLAKKLFVLVSLVLICYCPYFSLHLIRALYPHLVSQGLFRTLAWLRYFNSCLNPFLYAYANPTIRKSMRRSLSRIVSWRCNT